MTRAVFFDRDGVLNEATVADGVPHPPATLAELRVVNGAREAVCAVRDAGFLALIVTNQPDVARGAATKAGVEAMSEAVRGAVDADGVYACLHDGDACDCRKPKPGLLLQAARERAIDLPSSFMIGDRGKDVACGRAAGCTTIFIDHGYGETERDPGADVTVRSLGAAVEAVLRRAPERMHR